MSLYAVHRALGIALLVIAVLFYGTALFYSQVFLAVEDVMQKGSENPRKSSYYRFMILVIATMAALGGFFLLSW